MEASELVGEILDYIDIDGETVRLETRSGRVFVLQHHQDCCEDVFLYQTDGDLRCLIGKPITEASRDNPPDPAPEDRNPESFTWTVFKFSVDGNTVVTRWFGESNGYYGEEVDIDEVTMKADGLIPRDMGITKAKAKSDDWLVIADYWECAGMMDRASICREIATNGHWGY